MASLGVHGQNALSENDKSDLTFSRLHAKSFDFQAATGNRKSLQTLQFSSTSDQQLVGKDGPIKQMFHKAGGKASRTGKQQKRSVIKPSQRPVHVYKDLSPKASPDKPIVEEDEAYQLMASVSIPESYWKLLADERRSALDDSLHENEMLHQEIEVLKDENSRLTELAGQAEYLASILQTAVESDEEDHAVESTCVVTGNDTADEAVDSTSDTAHSEKEENYLSSYDVISLTDEDQPTLSDDDCQNSLEKSVPSPVLQNVESDNVTLCSSPEVSQSGETTLSPKSPCVHSSPESLSICPDGSLESTPCSSVKSAV